MGTGTFFSKVASYDPLAHALHLPGANKYEQLQASQAAGQSGANGGPYTGQAPSLSAAAGGYAPGGPGSNVGWAPYVSPQIGNGFQRFASGTGAALFNAGGIGPATPSSVASGINSNPYPSYTPADQQGQNVNPAISQAQRTIAGRGGWGNGSF